MFEKKLRNRFGATLAVATLFFAGHAASVQASLLPYTSGHADIAVKLDGSKLELHIHADGAVIDGTARFDEEFALDEVSITHSGSPVITRPEGTQWDFTGAAQGEPLYVLPQTENTSLPFLGWATEEVGLASDWTGGITFALVNVTGPAHFSAWQTDGFGTITPWYSTADNTVSNEVTLSIGTHAHANIGFTEIGLYEVTLKAFGTHTTHGELEDTATFTFEVIPEPASLALLAAGGLLMLRRRRRA